MSSTFIIQNVDQSLKNTIQNKIDSKTKPLGALGLLEEIAMRVALIQRTSTPTLHNPHILVFAGDHGVAASGVSAYPQEVTWQMVMNFIQGGAAINVFCRQHNLKLYLVDAGVNYKFGNVPGLINNKVGLGTKNFATQPAMSAEQAQQCIDKGATLIKDISDMGCNCIGFGEMGIGNTSSASMLMSLICNIPIEHCVGRGTGLDDSAYNRKVNVLQKALALHQTPGTALHILSVFGGFEIAQMVGGMLQAAASGMVILIDGFIATAAYLVAHAMNPALADYCFFCHESQEQGHKLIFDHLKVTPLLNLKMRLGEGTGAAVAYPIFQSAVAFLNEMASFESAQVSNKV